MNQGRIHRYLAQKPYTTTGGSDGKILNQNCLYAYFCKFFREKSTCIFSSGKSEDLFFLEADFSDAKFLYTYIFFNSMPKSLVYYDFSLVYFEKFKKRLVYYNFSLVYS